MWKIKWVELYGDQYTELVREGWEPFSAQIIGALSANHVIVFLRKQEEEIKEGNIGST